MRDWLAERAEATPDKIAIIVGEESWAFAELDKLASEYTHGLFNFGVRPGDLVGVLLPNSLEYVGIVFASMRLQSTLVPLNTRLSPVELSWQIEKIGCRWVIADDTTQQQLSGVELSCKVIHLATFKRLSHAAEHITPPNFDLDTTQALIFTSGTSGKPKAVQSSYRNHYNSAMASAERLGVEQDDCWLSCLPLYHVGGLAILFRSCLYGTSVVVHQGFDLQHVQNDLTHKPITIVSLVPTMLHRMLQDDTWQSWNKFLRLILLGGAAASLELVQQCIAYNLPIALTYGLSEAASQVATATPEQVRHKPLSVGKALPGTQITIVNEQREQVATGETGEIVVAGGTVMLGYYENEAATVNTLVDGELYTGDMGYLDDDEDLFVVQRRSDLIVSGGENIYPIEVEQILKQHPAIQEACVVGIPHPEWGQQVSALVVTSTMISTEEIASYIRNHLAAYKMPRVIQITDQLPLTASGKIEREAVKKILMNGMKQDV